MNEASKAAEIQFNVTGEELRQFIERVEQLESEKKDIAEQVKEVFAEIKGRGFDVKAIRAIIRERQQNPDDVAEQEAILELYRSALGMVIPPETKGLHK